MIGSISGSGVYISNPTQLRLPCMSSSIPFRPIPSRCPPTDAVYSSTLPYLARDVNRTVICNRTPALEKGVVNKQPQTQRQINPDQIPAK
jgi:hypothetical protein